MAIIFRETKVPVKYIIILTYFLDRFFKAMHLITATSKHLNKNVLLNMLIIYGDDNFSKLHGDRVVS